MHRQLEEIDILDDIVYSSMQVFFY